MRFLTAVFESHEEFLAHFSDKYRHGALFCRTRAREQLGSNVVVDVSLAGMEGPARLIGEVISISDREGVWVAFQPQSSAAVSSLQTHDSSTSNGSERLSRAHSRYPASLEVLCRIDEDNPETETLHGKIVDLSRGGAFVSGSEAPQVGTRVSLAIDSSSSSASSYRVDGRVAWVGSVDQRNGFGVRFDQRGNFGAAPLRAMLRRASEIGTLHLVS